MVDRRVPVQGSGIARADASAVLLLFVDTFSLYEGRVDGGGIIRMVAVGAAKRACGGPGHYVRGGPLERAHKSSIVLSFQNARH